MRTLSLFRYSLPRLFLVLLLQSLLLVAISASMVLYPFMRHSAENVIEDMQYSLAGRSGKFRILHDAPPDGGASWVPFIWVLKTELQQKMHPDTRLRIIDGQSETYFVSSPAWPDQYLVFDRRQVIGASPRLAMGLVFLLAVLLALAAAWWLARRLRQPLLQMAKSVDRLRDRDAPEFIPAEIRLIEEYAVLYRQFVETSQNLRQSAGQRTTLLLGLSHELRAPLTRLRMAVELLENKLGRNQFATMVRAIDSMSEILASFVDAADSLGQHTRNACSFDSLASYLTEHFQFTQRLTIEVGQKHAQLNLAALKRVVANLCDNALKHAPDSTVLVRISSTQPGCRIDILDRGSGIPSSELDAVFTPFHSTGKRQDHNHLGLGLALARILAEQNGWRLELRNRSGGGLCASVLMPYVCD